MYGYTDLEGICQTINCNDPHLYVTSYGTDYKCTGTFCVEHLW